MWKTNPIFFYCAQAAVYGMPKCSKLKKINKTLCYKCLF